MSWYKPLDNSSVFPSPMGVQISTARKKPLFGKSRLPLVKHNPAQTLYIFVLHCINYSPNGRQVKGAIVRMAAWRTPPGANYL
jgi:hypothetical protein